jgi:transcriptional regulator EpsA
MDAPAELTEREVEYFLRFVERSLSVRNRHHFFLWVRGELQALLPHALLICARREREAARWEVSPVAEVPYPQELLRELCAVDGGFLGRVMQECRAADGLPVLACPVLNGSGYLRFRPDLERYGFDTLAAHGLLAVEGEVASCFGFIGIPPPLTPRHAYLLQILVPYLHAALVRTLIDARGADHADSGSAPPLTRREIEILGAVQQGLSNAEIAHALGVSPLTVKNHVQRILRKLGAHNRAQAVAYGIARQIIAQTLPPSLPVPATALASRGGLARRSRPGS